MGEQAKINYLAKKSINNLFTLRLRYNTKARHLLVVNNFLNRLVLA